MMLIMIHITMITLILIITIVIIMMIVIMIMIIVMIMITKASALPERRSHHAAGPSGVARLRCEAGTEHYDRRWAHRKGPAGSEVVRARRQAATGVCEKNTPPEKNTPNWNISFQITKPGVGLQFLLLGFRARARRKEFLLHRRG